MDFLGAALGISIHVCLTTLRINGTAHTCIEMLYKNIVDRFELHQSQTCHRVYMLKAYYSGQQTIALPFETKMLRFGRKIKRVP